MQIDKIRWLRVSPYKDINQQNHPGTPVFQGTDGNVYVLQAGTERREDNDGWVKWRDVRQEN